MGSPVQSPCHDLGVTAAIAGRALGPPCIPPGSRHPDKQHRNPILLRLVSRVPWALPRLWHGAANPARHHTLGILPTFVSRAPPHWATVESLLSAPGLLQPRARAGLQLLCPSRLRIRPFLTWLSSAHTHRCIMFPWPLCAARL